MPQQQGQFVHQFLESQRGNKPDDPTSDIAWVVLVISSNYQNEFKFVGHVVQEGSIHR